MLTLILTWFAFGLGIAIQGCREGRPFNLGAVVIVAAIWPLTFIDRNGKKFKFRWFL